MRCQGFKAACSTLIPSSSVPVKVWQAKIAVCQGVKVLSPDIFAGTWYIPGIYFEVGDLSAVDYNGALLVLRTSGTSDVPVILQWVEPLGLQRED